MTSNLSDGIIYCCPPFFGHKMHVQEASFFVIVSLYLIGMGLYGLTKTEKTRMQEITLIPLQTSLIIVNGRICTFFFFPNCIRRHKYIYGITCLFQIYDT